MGLYFGLLAWLGHTAWRLGSTFLSGGLWLAALPALFLVAVLVKGLFYVRKGEVGTHLVVDAASEPTLIAFVHRIADEAGAPRPHKVYLTPDVNASVFHDLSFWNLLFPSKKNLVIGLGLVNVVTLDELKAVLAHEFGHFAQRTMAVGTWVYAARQAIGAIVARRDGFDKLLEALSAFDIRVAWVGWAMRLLVWSVRVVLDTAFRGVVLLERALSREMEFQADLVSVSLCGSDSLVHALRRLGAADEALTRALGTAMGEARRGGRIADLYDVQDAWISWLRRVRNDPDYGAVPSRPADAQAHRVFSPALAEVPRMWSTHPPSHEREESAKRRYFPSTLDPRPAWVVFAAPEATRRAMTAKVYEDALTDGKERPVAEPEATRAQLAERQARAPFDPAYRGVYLGRSVTLAARTPADLTVPVPLDAVGAALDALYPEDLVDTLRAWRAAETEAAQLEALADGVLEAPGGVIRFRGQTLRRSELPEAVAEAKHARDSLERALVEHDRAVRSAHRAAARILGQGWEAHLASLAATLHYLEHQGRNLDDANEHLANVFAVVTADRRVSSSELTRLVKASNELQGALQEIYARAEAVVLPPPVLAKLEAASWSARLGEQLQLPPATPDLLGKNWLPAAGSWYNAASSHLEAAAMAATEALLEAEAHVARAYREDADPGPAPAPAKLPAGYTTLVPGDERPRQKRLDAWSRFVTADGFGAGALRLAVAGGVLAPAVLVATTLGSATVVVYDGLALPVRVLVGEESFDVGPGVWREVSVAPSEALTIAAATADGREIEAFTVTAEELTGRYVYNVGQGAVLASIAVPYGDIAAREPQLLGAPRWGHHRADYFFAEPPASIESRRPEVRERILAVDLTPPELAGLVPEEEAAGLVGAHLAWDPVTSEGFEEWLRVGQVLGLDVAAALARHPDAERGSVEFGRVDQETDHDAACARAAAAAAARPDDGDAAYLAVRCLDGAEADARVAEAAGRFPDNVWLRWALARSQARAHDYAGALTTLDGVKIRVLRHALADLRLRLSRATGAPGAVYAAELSAQERAMLAVEAGEPPDGEVDPILLALVRGDLAEASRRCDELGGEADGFRWMIAASDGATPAMREAALGLPGGVYLGSVSAIPAVALLAQAGRDRAEAEAVLAKMGPELLASLRPVLDAAPGGVASAVEAAVAGQEPEVRARVLLVGILRLGEAAPAEWRTEARALLFPWERPYLRPE